MATLSLAPMLASTPTLAEPRQVTKVATSAKNSSANPLQYVQRGTSAKSDFVRTLSLFGNGRALLVSNEADTKPVTVQTGTWKRGARADRFSISLTRQNEKPYKEIILLTGTPGKGGMLSAIGTVSTQYGAYGLTFAPRIPNKVSLSWDDKKQEATLTATGVMPTPLGVVKQASITADGYDAIYWKKGDMSGSINNEGDSLYHFNTLTGKAHRIAWFPMSITKVHETRLSSGRPVLIVSYQSDGTGETGVAVVDPLRERTVKEWRHARLTGITPGKITIVTDRRQGSASDNAKPTGTQIVSLDRFF